MTTAVTQPEAQAPTVSQWPHFIPVIGLVVIAVLFALGGIGEGGSHSIDDVVVIILALAGVAWIVPTRNRRSRSLIPLGLVSGALVMKLVALAIEHGDKGDLGDDIAAVLFLVVLLILSGIAYLVTQRRPRLA